jgi:hypothetical protein
MSLCDVAYADAIAMNLMNIEKGREFLQLQRSQGCPKNLITSCASFTTKFSNNTGSNRTRQAKGTKRRRERRS